MPKLIMFCEVLTGVMVEKYGSTLRGNSEALTCGGFRQSNRLDVVGAEANLDRRQIAVDIGQRIQSSRTSERCGQHNNLRKMSSVLQNCGCVTFCKGSNGKNFEAKSRFGAV